MEAGHFYTLGWRLDSHKLLKVKHVLCYITEECSFLKSGGGVILSPVILNLFISGCTNFRMSIGNKNDNVLQYIGNYSLQSASIIHDI